MVQKIRSTAFRAGREMPFLKLIGSISRRAVLWAIAFCASIGLFADESKATPIYSVQPCGGIYDPCTVQQAFRTPTADQLVGLDSQLFADYFTAEHIYHGEPGGFSFSIRDSSPEYIIGTVSGPNEIHTQFVFSGGALLCCIADDPFVIRDINDEGLVVGNNIYFAGPYVTNAPNAQHGFMPLVDPNGIQIGDQWQFLAIDNSDNILAECNGPPQCSIAGFYELRGVDEPSPLMLLAAIPILLLLRVNANPIGRVSAPSLP